MSHAELLRRPDQPPLWVDAEPRLRFVVQKHLASRLHYDLRLELDGVLVSFAVPKGPSLNPEVNRLAVRVDDHAMSCLGFEGRIDDGIFRGGPMIVWDTGLYVPPVPQWCSQEEVVHEGLRSGRLRLALHGQKLKGSWVMIRRNGLWLLRKERDRFASRIEVLDQDRSVLTGRRIEELGTSLSS